jgi:uncharacterized protein involved in exopolysaccharide biosynthesis
MDDSVDDSDEGASHVSVQELFHSYLAFIKRALKHRWPWTGALFVVGMIITVLIAVYYPRTYTSRTVLMGEGNKVLEGHEGPISLAGADSLIARHDNLEALIKSTDLARKRDERRPPILKLKDRAIAWAFGPIPKDQMTDILIGTLETRLMVEVKGNILDVSVDWNDGETAAELAEAARESFVKSRHTAEISAFQEKMGILEGHAANIRKEIEELAKQIQTLAEQKVAEAERKAEDGAKTKAKDKDSDSAPAPRIRVAPRPVARGSEAAGQQLAEKQRKLSALETDRETRLRAEQAKVDELRLTLTPSHPDMVEAQRRLALVAQPSSEVMLLRAEINTLLGEVEQQTALDALRPTPGGRRPAGALLSETLPTEIMALLDEEVDPAMQEQLRGAVMKFGSIRQELRSARIELDTAQAAFAHRYKIVVPAEPPQGPRKPKVIMIVLGGLAASLLIGLLFPILAELNRGVISEHWQVHQLQLPVLADLKLPPRSAE